MNPIEPGIVQTAKPKTVRHIPTALRKAVKEQPGILTCLTTWISQNKSRSKTMTIGQLPSVRLVRTHSAEQKFQAQRDRPDALFLYHHLHTRNGPETLKATTLPE